MLLSSTLPLQAIEDSVHLTLPILWELVAGFCGLFIAGLGAWLGAALVAKRVRTGCGILAGIIVGLLWAVILVVVIGGITEEGRRTFGQARESLLASLQRMTELPRETHSSMGRLVAYSEDGFTLASVGVDGTVYAWRETDGLLVADTLPGGVSSPGALTVSADGSLIAASDKDKVLLWREREESWTASLPLLAAPTMQDLAFSPDGYKLAGAAGALYLWDLEEPGDAPTILIVDQHELGALAFGDQDSGLLAAGSDAGVIFLWQTPWIGDEPVNKMAITLPVKELIYLPGRELFVAGAGHGLYTLTPGMPRGKRVFNAESPIQWIGYAAEADRLIAASPDVIHVWPSGELSLVTPPNSRASKHTIAGIAVGRSDVAVATEEGDLVLLVNP